jgi:hypothetical protein
MIYEQNYGRHAYLQTQVNIQTYIHIFIVSHLFLMIFMIIGASSEDFKYMFELHRWSNYVQISLVPMFTLPNWTLLTNIMSSSFFVHFEQSLYLTEVHNISFNSKGNQIISQDSSSLKA